MLMFIELLFSHSVLTGGVTDIDVHLSPTNQCNFDQMRIKLGKLFYTVARLIEHTVELNELKSYLETCFPELSPQLVIAISFNDVKRIIREKCNVINVCCLEDVVDQFDIKEAKPHITTYKLAVDDFCEKVKVSVCENINFMSASSSLLKCETIQFILEWQPDEHTFQDIRLLLWKAFEDMAKRVLVSIVKKGNSIIVICYAPRNIMDVLLMKAKLNLDQLQKIRLIKLTLGYYIVWDGRTTDKVINK